MKPVWEMVGMCAGQDNTLEISAHGHRCSGRRDVSEGGRRKMTTSRGSDEYQVQPFGVRACLKPEAMFFELSKSGD